MANARNCLVLVLCLGLLALGTPPTTTAAGPPQPTITLLYSGTNQFGHLVVTQTVYAGQAQVEALFISAAGASCEHVAERDGTVTSYLPTGTVVFEQTSGSIWRFVLTSTSGQSWTVNVNKQTGNLVSTADEIALQAAAAAIGPGSEAVSTAARDFLSADGLAVSAMDGFTLTGGASLPPKGKCALSALLFVGSYSAFISCAMGALPFCLIGIVSHTGAAFNFAQNCFGG